MCSVMPNHTPNTIDQKRGDYTEIREHLTHKCRLRIAWRTLQLPTDRPFSKFLVTAFVSTMTLFVNMIALMVTVIVASIESIPVTSMSGLARRGRVDAQRSIYGRGDLMDDRSLFWAHVSKSSLSYHEASTIVTNVPRSHFQALHGTSATMYVTSDDTTKLNFL